MLDVGGDPRGRARAAVRRRRLVPARCRHGRSSAWCSQASPGVRWRSSFLEVPTQLAPSARHLAPAGAGSPPGVPVHDEQLRAVRVGGLQGSVDERPHAGEPLGGHAAAWRRAIPPRATQPHEPHARVAHVAANVAAQTISRRAPAAQARPLPAPVSRGRCRPISPGRSPTPIRCGALMDDLEPAPSRRRCGLRARRAGPLRAAARSDRRACRPRRDGPCLHGARVRGRRRGRRRARSWTCSARTRSRPPTTSRSRSSAAS